MSIMFCGAICHFESPDPQMPVPGLKLLLELKECKGDGSPVDSLLPKLRVGKAFFLLRSGPLEHGLGI